MASRLFDQLDVINVTEGYVSPPFALHASGSISSTGFADFTLSGGGSDSTGSGVAAESNWSGQYQKIGTIDFTKFPSIPANAVISKIEFKVELSTYGQAEAHTTGVASAEADVNAVQSAALGFIRSGTPAWLAQLTQNVHGSDATDPADVNISDSQSYPAAFADVGISYPVDYNYLVANFGNIILQLYISVTGRTVGTGALATAGVNFVNHLRNFGLKITYTSGPYSWYLTNHPSTIDGQPVTIVDDKVPVDDGDAPPAGAIYYGPGNGAPPDYDWYYPPTGDIIRQPIPPGTGWKLQFIDYRPAEGLRFDFATESVTVALIDPSGIYTLVEGKTHDTLYERSSGITYVNVKIPNPFAKTGFIP